MRAWQLVGGLCLVFLVACAADEERQGSIRFGDLGGAPGGGGGAASGETAILVPGAGGKFEECAGAVFPGDLVPVDLYVLMDRSQSMIIGDALEQSRTAITDFLSLPDLDSVSMGLGFFPLPSRTQSGKDSCDVQDYSVPEVPIGLAYGMATDLIGAMNAVEADGATPMHPAVDGAMGYLQTWAADHPSHISALVLATDGSPSTCNPETVRSVANLVEQGRTGTPSIPTFVVGFGLGPDLREISEAGGTDVFDVTVSDVETELLEALDDIRRIGECRYQIPATGSEEVFDPLKINVQNLAPGAGAELLPQAVGAEGCGSARAWHYDDPLNPNQIVLCPQSCEAVKAASSDVQVVVGCETLFI